MKFCTYLYVAADFGLDERHVIKNKKSCIGQTSSSTERISYSQNVFLTTSKRYVNVNS